MTELVDVTALLDGAGPRVRWSASTGQLQANLVTLQPGERVEPHVEPELDVLVVVVAGSGTVTADVEQAVTAPAVVVLEAGAGRAVAAGPDGLSYVTAHHQRAGMGIG